MSSPARSISVSVVSGGGKRGKKIRLNGKNYYLIIEIT